MLKLNSEIYSGIVELVVLDAGVQQITKRGGKPQNCSDSLGDLVPISYGACLCSSEKLHRDTHSLICGLLVIKTLITLSICLYALY